MSDKLQRYDPDLATHGEWMKSDERGNWCASDDVEKLEARLAALLKVCRAGPIVADPQTGHPGAYWVCFRNYDATIAEAAADE